ncbi:hypothetical protein [Nannocystis punicea]|uniref:Uncharacterized protein n=1 Tax=Nannocystis punicea TaxID=2995304 RepID=A0ABY7H6D9_9BACT|nr:hypothetical protein [Nannocystis poenicansa]WAS94846.1 hypothetical protein O0S08_01685 [Nannocystis poenicansa]
MVIEDSWSAHVRGRTPADCGHAGDQARGFAPKAFFISRLIDRGQARPDGASTA